MGASDGDHDRPAGRGVHQDARSSLEISRLDAVLVMWAISDLLRRLHTVAQLSRAGRRAAVAEQATASPVGGDRATGSSRWRAGATRASLRVCWTGPCGPTWPTRAAWANPIGTLKR